MIKIKSIPVGYPSKEANAISIRVLPFQTTAKDCITYYELFNITTILDEDGNENIVTKKLADGNIPIIEEQFANWGSDNAHIEDIVLTVLSLERL